MNGMRNERCIEAPGIAVQGSRIAGNGLFTTLPREAGERIASIEGEVIDGDEAERRDAAGNVYIYEMDEATWLDAAAGIGRHVNHSCEPTCGVEGRNDRSLWIVAARALAAGEELTIDYDYPEIFEACRALNPACRGTKCPRAIAASS